MAASSSRVGGGSKASLPKLFSSDRLKLTPPMSAAAAQLLIKLAHELINHPNRSPQKTPGVSDKEGTLEHTMSFDNGGQVTAIPKDEAEEDDIDSLADPGDPAIQALREVAVAKIRPIVWATDAADVKRIKQKQMSLRWVSNKQIFTLFDPKLGLEDVLDLIVSNLAPRYSSTILPQPHMSLT